MQVGGQILFMETIWRAWSEPHQTHTRSSILSLTHPPLPSKPASSLPLLPLYLVSDDILCHFTFTVPLLSSSLPLKKKRKKEKKILLINAWQLQGAVLTSFFHGNGLSVSADRISVLVATCSFARAEHIHVLNRRNYCNIPEIESPSRSLAIIFSAHKKHGCPRRDSNRGAEMTG